jgi:hypothetical protein
VVVHERLAQEAGWELGERIILSGANGREATFEIAGTLFDPANGRFFLPPGHACPIPILFCLGNQHFVRRAGGQGSKNTLFIRLWAGKGRGNGPGTDNDIGRF